MDPAFYAVDALVSIDRTVELDIEALERGEVGALRTRDIEGFLIQHPVAVPGLLWEVLELLGVSSV